MNIILQSSIKSILDDCGKDDAVPDSNGEEEFEEQNPEECKSTVSENSQTTYNHM